MKLSLYFPTKPHIINQGFGTGSAYYSAQGLAGHNGIDFNAKHGQPVYASHDGRALYEVDSGGGHGVVILSNDFFDYNGAQVKMKSIYWHFCDPLKEPKYQSPIGDKGQWVSVKAGDLIGYADNTGGSTGDHLHFGLKPVTQGEYDWVWMNYEQQNGYFGAIDPTPYFNGLYAEDLAPHATPTFTRDLTLGSKGEDVRRLQQYLNAHHFPVALAGLGSAGHETDYFGNLTMAALARFQKANNIVPSVGYFGPITRQFINSHN